MHWQWLTQNIALLVSNPKSLIESLKLLLDESKPISDRIDKVIGVSGERTVKGLGLARISDILHYSDPEKYGVYNNVSMGGLSKIGENPKDTDPRWNSLTKGERYSLVNKKLIELSKSHNISLWALDWLWYWILENNTSDKSPNADVSDESPMDKRTEEILYKFGLEKHLEEFLVENWAHTTLYKDLQLDILKDEETGETIGQQYKLENGKKIDILCKNRKTDGFTVIELKRGGTSTDVVGQIKMYMGWLKKNFANGKQVDGIIIAQEYSEDIKYALLDEKDIQLLTFRIGFELNKEKLDL